MANLRKLGVHSSTLPTRKSQTVEPAPFAIAGIIGQFERKYDQVFSVNSPTQKQDIFGDDINSSWYGSEECDAFFNNSAGSSATLYIKSHVGYTGSVIDAVVASTLVVNQDSVPATLLTLKAGYQVKSGGAFEYGISGNRTGYTIINGTRFGTTVSTIGNASDTFLVVSSVADIQIGDTLKITLTGGGGATVYQVVTGVDSNTKKVSFAGAVHATIAPAVNDVVVVMGIQIHTWRKDINGNVKEVDVNLGKIYCSINAQVSAYYVENIFSTSKWIDITRAATTPTTPNVDFPVNVSTVTYLTSGADGTTPTTSAHWSKDLSAFDLSPIRFLCNPESSNQTIQMAGEAYCKARTDDTPKWIINFPINQTKAQLITLGNNWQRSDDVMAMVADSWIEITDPFSSSPLAQPRNIPNVAFIMGLYVYTIITKGIHFIPQLDTPLNGLVGLYNSNMIGITDDDRTDLANAGVNVIQYVNGYGYILRNSFTPSTAPEFKFMNGIVMREFVRISGMLSLATSENTPNSLDRIKENGDAMNQFMYSLWLRGSTGTNRQGETFGQSQNPDGTLTKFPDHVQVTADLTNNPIAKINLGERNIDTYFTFPSPAGSIQVRSGLWLKS